MKKTQSSAILFLIFIFFGIAVHGQEMELKFTAQLNGSHVNIDSVRVTNVTQAGDTVLYWPDTTLFMGYLGLGELPALTSGFSMQMAGPNPVADRFLIQLKLPVPGQVVMKITEISGKTLCEIDRNFSAGLHLFCYFPSKPGIYVVSARFESEVKSLKLISAGQGQGSNSLIYNGIRMEDKHPKYELSTLPFVFTSGDSLHLTGWYNGNKVTLKTAPFASANYVFPFGMNFPCPGLPQFVYGGQTYNTVQIGTQCWMKENLNIGNMVVSTNTGYGHSNCTDNGIVEKYCYFNDPANCVIYGGLYDWDELRQYAVDDIQGICPAGWHIPTDGEWCILTTYLDSTVDCSPLVFTGVDAGRKLKQTGSSMWAAPNDATNESGFTALGTGFREHVGYFEAIGEFSMFWTSSADTSSRSIFWFINNFYADVSRYIDYNTYGHSVRCLRD